jgi:hypothetical protein
MPRLIPDLIDKRDNVEIVRDQVAAILKVELAHQQTLTTELQPRVFVERSLPWGEYLEVDARTRAPIINVWFEGETFDGSASNIVERQAAEATINIDCYGYGVSVDGAGSGHVPGDQAAALEAQRAVRLARNILMAGVYTYLGLRGVVGKRWPRSIEMFQPPIDNRAVQRVVGARMALSVRFNEFSPQYVGEELETLLVEVRRAGTGEVLLLAEYPGEA